MFVSASEQDATPRPGRVAPSATTGFFDVLTAGFTSEAIETDWHNYTGRRVGDTYRTIYSALSSALGEERVQEEMQSRGLRVERLPGRRSLDQIWSADPRYGQALLDMAQGQIEDFFGPVPATREQLAQGVYDDIRSEWDDAAATLEMGGAGSGVAEFLGRGGAAMSDAVSLVTLPLGAGAGSFGRALLMEAALGAAGEAAILPRQYQQAERLGTPEPDPIAQIAMGAAFGGALGVAGEGLSRALTYTRLRRSLTRIPDDISMPEAQAAIEGAQQALEAGEPVPPIVREDGPMLEPAPLEVQEAAAAEGAPGPQGLPSREEIDAQIQEIRQQNPEVGRARPTLEQLLQLGGIQWRRSNPNTGESELTPIAQELRGMGITAQNLVGIIRRNGMAEIDNIVATEFADGGTPRLRTDDTGTYLDRDALLEAIAQEVGGRPAYRTIEAEDAAARVRDLEDNFEAIRREMDEIASAEGVPSRQSDDTYLTPPRDGEDALDRADAAERMVERYVDSLPYQPNEMTRLDAAMYLAETGGDVETAVTRAIMDAIEEDYYAAQGSQAPQTGGSEGLSPSAADAGPGGRDGAAADGAGEPPQNARSDGRGSEATPAGEQSLIPGVEPVTARQRLEAQQNAPMRGGEAVADDGLFDMNARLQRDMFDDPESPAMQARLDVREEEMRAAMEGLDDVMIELEGETVSARSLLDDIEADRAHAEAIETCGWTGGGQ